MGLAPYGEPKYKELILRELVDIKNDGSIRLNMDYFNYAAGLTMTNERFNGLFGGPPRQSEGKMTQKEMDLARSIQEVTEDIVSKMAEHIKKETGQKHLCMAGGVALNCVSNGKLLRKNIFDDIWIQPASGDAGGALGAALFVWHQYLGNEKISDGINDLQSGSYLGPEFEDNEILKFLENNKIPYRRLADGEIAETAADLIAGGKVIGWFQGRMEFGPRALGSRSIVGDARSPKMQSIMNLKIKFRESFRPFAPSVLAEKASDYFDIDRESPYMLLVAEVKKEHRREMSAEEKHLFGIDKLNIVRSDIPAVTHIDYSARLHTVRENTNPRYHAMIKKFYDKYGCPAIINTSFNVRGEPIVCSPKDAYICFMRTEMDNLFLENFLLEKNGQPPLKNDSDWRKEFELD